MTVKYTKGEDVKFATYEWQEKALADAGWIKEEDVPPSPKPNTAPKPKEK